MSIEHAKAILVQTAWYASDTAVGDFDDKLAKHAAKLVATRSIYREFVDMCGFDQSGDEAILDRIDKLVSRRREVYGPVLNQPDPPSESQLAELGRIAERVLEPES